MSSYYNPIIGARGGNACHRRRPFSSWEIERLERYHRQSDSNVVSTQAGQPVELSKRRIRIDGKLVSVPKDKRQRSLFVKLLKSGMDWYRALGAISLNEGRFAPVLFHR